MAFRAETALPAISLLELGKTLPRIETVIRLAGALRVTPNDLVAGIDWMPAEIVATPGSFEVPDDPELALEVAELRSRTRGFRGRRAGA